jgi:hypothetical protein
MPNTKFLVEATSGVSENAGNDLDAVFAELVKAGTGYERVWVLDRSHDAAYPSVDKGVGARRRLSVVGMRFKRNVCGSAAGEFSCLLQSQHFGVRFVFV